MDDPTNIFSEAISKTFTSLDSETKEDIRKKVLGYMLVRLEEESFQNDPKGAKELHDKMDKMNDDKDKATLYGKMISKKFSELSEEERKSIINKLDSEIVEVMNKIYQQAK